MAEKERHPGNTLGCNSVGTDLSSEHAFLLTAPLESYCLVTVFKHFTDSHVMSRQVPSSNPQVPGRE